MKKDIMISGLVVLLAAFLLYSLVILPISYFDGSAKSYWLKETRGIEIPWYRACWLVVEINSVDGELNLGE